ncbi:MAG TPA: type II toxin-antitoxin system VapC family toxin [Candidatus Nanoarchaeia archaeon]|nr:type II toxin-antitoxin system VapC family toxin [Candidatus Nanoarchaeia archaeon]
MRIVLDTSVIVEIDRKNPDVIKIVKKLIDNGSEIILSMITVSEILTGSHLTKNAKESVLEAKRIMGQFIWVELDAEIAEKTAQYLAYLISHGKIIEYQDVAIAATFKATDSDYILTLNKAHFEHLPELSGKIYTPAEFSKKLKN